MTNHHTCCLVALAFLVAPSIACGSAADETVDSSDVPTSRIQPSFEVEELPDGRRAATAVLLEWTGGSNGSGRRRVRLTAADRLTVETERGGRTLEPATAKNGTLQYRAELAPDEGDRFTFVLARTNERKTGTVTFPAAITTTGPTPDTTLSLGAIVKVRFTTATEDRVDARVEGPCVTQSYVALVGADVTGPGFRAVQLNASKAAAPCGATLSVKHHVFGVIDEGFGGEPSVQPSMVHAYRYAREVAVRIVP